MVQLIDSTEYEAWLALLASVGSIPAIGLSLLVALITVSTLVYCHKQYLDFNARQEAPMVDNYASLYNALTETLWELATGVVAGSLPGLPSLVL